MSRLPRSFYQSNDVVKVARALLGKKLVTRINGQVTSGIITETEAYHESEKACHAYNGRKTSRTEVLFESGGMSYVYLCYGIHNLFNVVTGHKGEAAAVLVRAIAPSEGMSAMLDRRSMDRLESRLSAGPGMLTQALGLTLKNNRASLTSNRSLWIEPSVEIDASQILVSSRIGVDYAEEDAHLPWRFYLKDCHWVSKRK
jgi:DNA-3-methyladenine glycosylase